MMELPDDTSTDTSLCQKKLLEISGWMENEIDSVLQDATLPEKRTPNIAFFAILITKIEQSETLHLQHDISRLLPKLGLRLPDHLSSFIRFVRRNTDKAFKKQVFSPLSAIPVPVLPKPSIVGPLCQDAGISENWLFNNSDVYTGQVTITLGVVLELNQIKNAKGVTDRACASWVQRLFHLDTMPHPSGIHRQWGRIVNRASSMRGKKDEKAVYLSLPYRPPSKPVSVLASVSQPLVSVPCPAAEGKNYDIDNTIPVPTLMELAGKRYSASVVNEVPVAVDLRNIEVKQNLEKTQLAGLQEQIQVATCKLDKLKHRAGHYNTKNVYKRDKRAVATRKSLENSLKEIQDLNTKVTSLENAKSNALKQKSKWKMKATQCDKCDLKNAKISRLNDSVQELECKIDCRSEIVSDQLKAKEVGDTSVLRVVKTKEIRDGHVGYSDEIRLVYMELLSLGVSVEKCSHVVRAVLNGLTDLDIEKLPAKSTTSGFQSECETVAQMHVADVMLQNQDLTLHLDGTKKKFKEYGSFQVSRSLVGSDVDGNAKSVVYDKETLSIGIQEMSKGDSDSFVGTLMSILGDLAETFSDDKENINKIKTNLSGNIRNLMTDRHVVNKSFKDKLEKTRRDLFEKYLTEFPNLSKERQDQLVKLHGLFCGLHVLANMGTAAAKALKVFEEIALPPGTTISEFAFKKGNSRTFDLIFELSQSMTVSGSMRTGRFADWEAFLKEKEKTNRLVSFLRHRFNVLFVNGAGAYFHKEDIKEFLKCQNKNKMLNCITDSVHSPVCIAALRALGIFAVLITQPLWRVVERQNIHVFDLNKHWLDLKTSLDQFSKDSSDLLSGHSVFPDFPVPTDVVYEELFRPTTDEIQNLTKECLEIICFHTLILVKRQLEDQLPGGKYSMPTVEVFTATKSCPTTNRAGEKDFSDLDREVKRAPQRLTSHISGAICFRNNKTWNYFKKLPLHRRQHLMKRAIKLAPQKRIKNQMRRKEVKETRMREMEERKEKAEAKKRKEGKRMNDIVNRIQELGGVWNSNETVVEHLASIPRETHKIQAMKDQILYQTVVLKKKFSNSKFSHKGQKFTLEQLRANFAKMLSTGLCGMEAAAVDNERTRHRIRQAEERREMIMAHRQEEIQKEAVDVTEVQTSIRRRRQLSVAGKLLKSATAVQTLKNRKRKAIKEGEQMPNSKQSR